MMILLWLFFTLYTKKNFWEIDKMKKNAFFLKKIDFFYAKREKMP